MNNIIALIAYKIWSIQRRLNDAVDHREGSAAIPIIIESSAIYSLALVSLTGLYATASWAQYIILNLLVPLVVSDISAIILLSLLMNDFIRALHSP